MDALDVVSLVPWAAACILALPGLVETKNTLDPRSWEVNLLVLSFGWLVFLSYRFHSMLIDKLSSLVHRFCDRIASFSLFPSRTARTILLLLGAWLIETLGLVLPTAHYLASVAPDLLPREEPDYPFMIANCALMNFWCLLSCRVPHQCRSVCISIAAVPAVLAPWYVLGLQWALTRVPPVMVKIWLEAKL